jgi:hypothetical protein
MDGSTLWTVKEENWDTDRWNLLKYLLKYSHDKSYGNSEQV